MPGPTSQAVQKLSQLCDRMWQTKGVVYTRNNRAAEKLDF